MNLWHLSPVDLDHRNWAASTYSGEVVVRALDERDARRLAARAFGIATSHVFGEEIRVVPWGYSEFVSATTRIESDEYKIAGEPEVVGPPKAISSTHHGYNS